MQTSTFVLPKMVIVAQPVRALVCGTRGRGFESRLSPILETLFIIEKGFFIV